MTDRVLVAWDWEADGIWRIRDRRATEAVAAPWSQLLTPGLLGALREWNDAAARADAGATAGARSAVLARGRLLAEATQTELGPGWQVLHVDPADTGAWCWVRPPWT